MKIIEEHKVCRINKYHCGMFRTFLEAVAQNQEAIPGSTASLKLEAINRSDINELLSVTTLPEKKHSISPKQ
jgi:hypothetical protein